MLQGSSLLRRMTAKRRYLGSCGARPALLWPRIVRRVCEMVLGGEYHCKVAEDIHLVGMTEFLQGNLTQLLGGEGSVIDNKAINLAERLDRNLNDSSRNLFQSVMLIKQVGSSYIGVGHIAGDVFHLARMRLFDCSQQLPRSSRKHNIVRMAQQTLSDGRSNALAGSSDNESLRCHVDSLLCNIALMKRPPRDHRASRDGHLYMIAAISPISSTAPIPPNGSIGGPVLLHPVRCIENSVAAVGHDVGCSAVPRSPPLRGICSGLPPIEKRPLRCVLPLNSAVSELGGFQRLK